MGCDGIMKDFNFFSSYDKKGEKLLDKEGIFYIVLSMVVIFTLCYGIFNAISIKKLNKDLVILQEKFEEKNQDETIKDLKKKEAEITRFKKDIDKIYALDNFVMDKDFLDDELLTGIESSLPNNLFISSMDLNNDIIKISGKSRDKKSIGQFQFNLKNLELFEELFIPQIRQEGNHFEFSIDMRFKEGEADEGEAETVDE